MAGARTPADITSLLMEFSRALKGYQFYPDGHPQLKETLERSLRSWQSNLENFGPLELDIQRGSFRLTGSKLAFGKGTLDDLARELAIRGIRRMRAEPDRASESFQALMKLLQVDADVLLEEGGASAWLIQNQVIGLTLNELDLHQHLDEHPEAQAEEDGTGQEVEHSPVVADLREGHDSPEPVHDEDTVDCPIERPSDSAAEELLGFLDACRDDEPYAKLTLRLLCLFTDADDSYISRDRFKSLYTFQRHINEAGSRSAAQRSIAREALRELSPEPITSELVQFSFSKADGSLSDTADILFELREHCTRAIITAIEQEQNPGRCEKIQEFLISLGQPIVPVLQEVLKKGSPAHVRIAARTTGLLSADSAVPALCRLLQLHRDDMCKEAVHALVRIGGREALHALADGLTSTQPKVASISAFGLGLWGSPEALAPLRARLHNVIDTASAESVLDLIRAIGKIGRAEASSDLAEILHRRTFFRRKRLMEIQLGAVAALAKIPSEGAQQALEAASRRGNRNVKKAAQDALDEFAARIS